MTCPGRPRKTNKDEIINILLKYKAEIVLPDDKIASSKHVIWEIISQELGRKKMPKSLYTYVCNNQDAARDILNNRERIQQSVHHKIPCNESDIEKSTDSETSTVDDARRVTISMKMSAFQQLLTCRKYKNREVNKLEPGVWQNEISERLWNATKIKCGFIFKNHYISSDLSTGSAKGTCKCKSTLDVQFEGTSERMLMHCTIIERKGTCGKRPLRQPYRSELAASLAYKSAERHRIEVANMKMVPGDPKPPTLPTASVMHVAKHEHLLSSLLDKDPIVAIAKMKRIGRTEEKLTIRNIGYDPFYVQYWTNHQNKVYEKYAKRETASLKIDATGGLVSKIRRADGTLSHHIFLYLAVVNSSAGQFSVTQMMTEAQDTGTIQNWLVQWIRLGAPLPKETVADASRALQTAIVRTFCGCTTIENYCDFYLTNQLPDCYVRIDVAHFLKTYSRALNDCHATRLVRKFYMGVIGKLVLCENLSTARDIIKDVLVVSLNETEGILGDSTHQTPCNISKKNLMDLITGLSPIKDLMERFEKEVQPELHDETGTLPERETSRSSLWSTWAAEIVKEVETNIVKGLFPNAHYCKAFSKHLIADIKHLPMWSCIYRNTFGYGRVPASSAPVEGEMNKLKLIDFNIELGNLRVDSFLQEHVANLNGKMLFADARMTDETDELAVVEEHSNGTDALSMEKDIQYEQVNEDIQADIFDHFNAKDSASNPPLQKENEKYTNESEEPEECAAVKKTCIACANGDEPTGAHTCAACNTEVHILEGCSYPIVDTSEGYGENRLCYACYSSTSAKEIVASRFEENWRGLGKSTKKQRERASKYLNNEEHLFGVLSFPKNVKIPVMRNGSFGCGTFTKASKTLGVSNTCAFDSVLQVIVLAFAENICLREAFEASENSFIHLAQLLTTQGLKGSYAYRLRTELLHKYLGQEEDRMQKSDKCLILNCAIGIPYAILHAFRNEPSCEEISKCEKECTYLVKKRAYITIPYRSLSIKNFDEVIKSSTILPKRPCEFCALVVETTLKATGGFIFLEVDDAENQNDIQLKSIPKSFSIYINGEDIKYNLVGIIHFRRPYGHISRKEHKMTTITKYNKDAVGHYTAICPRTGNKWTEFDDITAND